MNAITLWEPWATLIALKFKTIETRDHDRFWALKNKRIAIHAGRSFDDTAWLTIEELEDDLQWEIEMPDFRKVFGAQAWKALRDPTAWNQGRVVATAFVEDARRLTIQDSVGALCCAEGRFGLVLSNVERLTHAIPARGYQGVWEWTRPEEREYRQGVLI